MIITRILSINIGWIILCGEYSMWGFVVILIDIISAYSWYDFFVLRVYPGLKGNGKNRRWVFGLVEHRSVVHRTRLVLLVLFCIVVFLIKRVFRPVVYELGFQVLSRTRRKCITTHFIFFILLYFIYKLIY